MAYTMQTSATAPRPTFPQSSAPYTMQYDANGAMKRVPPVKNLVQGAADGKAPPKPTTIYAAVEDYTAKTYTALEEYKEKAKAQALELKGKMLTLVKDPQMQTLTITTGTGTVVVGAMGGAFGLASGMVTGAIAGIPPALFTFGLSIPAGAVVGGGAGSALGASTGAGVGALAGYGTFKYRIEIKNGLVYVKVKAMDAVELGKAKVSKTGEIASFKIASAVDTAKAKADELTTYAKAQTVQAVDIAKAKAGEAVQLATTTKVGVTCTSAAVGGVVGTASGGSIGVISGAAMGVIPAVFTFGLSIPVGAACGLCVGAGLGGATGATGGAAAGYGGFTYRKEISSGAQKAWGKARSSAESMKAKAMESATQVTESVRSLVGGGTGGTA